jgi:hypothetical protein
MQDRLRDINHNSLLNIPPAAALSKVMNETREFNDRFSGLRGFPVAGINARSFLSSLEREPERVCTRLGGK